jgi:hypothetical protein
MKILDRLPIAKDPSPVDVCGKLVKLRPYQIVLSVSLSDGSVWDPRTPTLPALLDTGNNLNFSIQESHLTRWAGIHPRFLPSLGVVREARRSPTLRTGRIWIHRNRHGSRALKATEPFRLSLEEGIAVYPSDESDYPRLPLLGLRAILKNNLRLVIDGKRKHVSLRSPLW